MFDFAHFVSMIPDIIKAFKETLIMIGISGGFVHGVGFTPRFWFWKWIFSPFLSWPLMLWGYYTWFLT